MITNVLGYLENSAELYDSKIACSDENTSYTYEQLMQKARRIGSALKGVKPRSPIPVFLDKECSTLATFMGIAYAGCFYIMLDTTQPAARIQIILETLQAQHLVVSQKTVAKAEKLQFKGEIFVLEELLEQPVNMEALHKVRCQTIDTDPLYSIFTSGSTGIPKGVIVSHRSVVDFIEHFTELFGITHNDIIGNQAPFDFDVSVKDIYSAFKTGATIQLIPKKMFSFPTKLLDYLEDRQVTTLIWAVSALCIVTTLNGFEYKVPSAIKKIIFSGEVMPVKHLNEWKRHYKDAMFVNVYGPTEITCNCTYYIVDREFGDEEMLPIGKPFPNEKVFLLDENNELVTSECCGRPGEICVSGTALSLGYYNNREKTDSVFTQNPLNKNYLELIYRTGDLGYFKEDGELYFLSRKDFQIKHMGHRIELGEIENAINAVEGVQRSCCIFDKEENKILAFVKCTVEKKEIIHKLGKKLPKYMIPNTFVEIEEVPVTKNGKIDRTLLLDRYRNYSAGE